MKTATQSNSPEKIKDFKISGDWATQSKKLKEQYSDLTDSDLKVETGKENDDMIARVGLKLDKKRDEVIRIIDEVIRIIRKGQSKKVPVKS